MLVIGYTTPLGHTLSDDSLLQFRVRGGVLEFANGPTYLRKRITGYRDFITGGGGASEHVAVN